MPEVTTILPFSCEDPDPQSRGGVVVCRVVFLSDSTFAIERVNGKDATGQQQWCDAPIHLFGFLALTTVAEKFAEHA